jgi:hypothetical protein
MIDLVDKSRTPTIKAKPTQDKGIVFSLAVDGNEYTFKDANELLALLQQGLSCLQFRGPDKLR